MIYNVNSHELRTDNGKLLKKLDCPLHKEWPQLTVIQETPESRHCGSCQKSVINLDGKTEQEVEALLEESPKCCIYIPHSSHSIKTEHYAFNPFVSRFVKVKRPDHEREIDPCPFRRIHTARGADAINQGVKDGFWPIVKRVKRSRRVSAWMEVYQNLLTGEIMTVGHHRLTPGTPWQRVVRSFRFYPHLFEHEVAAYLIPIDLKIGERVFLTDLIEDRIADYRGEHTLRLESAYAIWNGHDFRKPPKSFRMVCAEIRARWEDFKESQSRIG